MAWEQGQPQQIRPHINRCSTVCRLSVCTLIRSSAAGKPVLLLATSPDLLESGVEYAHGCQENVRETVSYLQKKQYP